MNRLYPHSPKRNPCSLTLCLTLLVLTCGVLGQAAQAAERPNILFFFTDDQRNDTLGCAGDEVVRTPNIDRLAKQGVRFENAFVTTSICWVSRATILTGQWNRTHGSEDRIDQVNPQSAANLFPKLLKQAGYRTGFFGKWHARMPKGYKQQQYFDRYVGIGRNPYFKKTADGGKRHETEIIGDLGVEFLESQPADQPFCLNLWFNAAHAEDGDKRPGIGHFPWPKAVDGMYEDRVMPRPDLDDPEIYESQPEFLKKSLNRVRYFWRWDTPEKYQVNMRAYYRMISGIDGVVERVLAKVDEKGFRDNTIVVYSADNGYYMGDRGFAGKWSHYEQSIRVPLIIHDPRVKQGGRVESRMALNVDLPATFLDWAGVEIPESYQGRSLAPLVRGEELATPWREDFFGEFLIRGGTLPIWEGVRGQRFMYAKYLEHNHEFLHDLKSDPKQLKNLASDPAHAQTLQRMRARTVELREVYGGEFQLP